MHVTRKVSPHKLATAVALTGLVLGCGGPAVPRGFIPGVTGVDGLHLPHVDASCSSFVPDTDQDGLSDSCELALAGAFAPALMVAPQVCDRADSTRLSRLAGEYLFAVRRLDSASLRISFLPAYYQDCGWSGAKCWLPFVDCSPHAGDSEFIVLDVHRGGTSGGWFTEAIFLSAHCFDDDRCRWYRHTDLGEFEWHAGRQRGVPVIWEAEGRHANYPSKAACDRGHSGLDTCDRNTVVYRYPVLDQNSNIGSLDYPFGDGRGCIQASPKGVQDSLAVAGAVECLWDPQSRFHGWQGTEAGDGVTPYYDYLTRIAGHRSGETDFVE